MINVKKITEEEALHLAHIASRLKLADRIIAGLGSAGIDFSTLDSDKSQDARKWFAGLCLSVAEVLSPTKSERGLGPKTKVVSPKPAKKKAVKAAKKVKKTSKKKVR